MSKFYQILPNRQSVYAKAKPRMASMPAGACDLNKLSRDEHLPDLHTVVLILGPWYLLRPVKNRWTPLFYNVHRPVPTLKKLIPK